MRYNLYLKGYNLYLKVLFDGYIGGYGFGWSDE